MLQTLSLVLLPALLTAAATSDVMSFRIPNWLTLLTAVLFFPMAWLTGMPLAVFGWHIAAGVLLFSIGFLLFQFNLFGGGDAKLMAAAGLWFGMGNVASFLVLTAYFGAALALCVLAWSAVMISSEIEGDTAPFANLWARLRKLSPNVPYGLAFALGGIVALKDTWWLHALH